jgi:hypothetical protein
MKIRLQNSAARSYIYHLSTLLYCLVSATTPKRNQCPRRDSHTRANMNPFQIGRSTIYIVQTVRNIYFIRLVENFYGLSRWQFRGVFASRRCSSSDYQSLKLYVDVNLVLNISHIRDRLVVNLDRTT